MPGLDSIVPALANELSSVPSGARDIAAPAPSAWYRRSIAESLDEPNVIVQSLLVTFCDPGISEPNDVTLLSPEAHPEAPMLVALTTVALTTVDALDAVSTRPDEEINAPTTTAKAAQAATTDVRETRAMQ